MLQQRVLRSYDRVLDFKPDITIDDRADLIFKLHKERIDLLPDILGGCEETTTGIHRLHAMEKERALKMPIIAVNDAMTKYLFDNRYGTGQSAWDGINRTTNLLVSGKNVVVAVYGWCGRGVAMRAAGLGASVIVTEIYPIRALEARIDGYRFMKMVEAAKLGISLLLPPETAISLQLNISRYEEWSNSCELRTLQCGNRYGNPLCSCKVSPNR